MHASRLVVHICTTVLRLHFVLEALDATCARGTVFAAACPCCCCCCCERALQHQQCFVKHTQAWKQKRTSDKARTSELQAWVPRQRRVSSKTRKVSSTTIKASSLTRGHHHCVESSMRVCLFTYGTSVYERNRNNTGRVRHGGVGTLILLARTHARSVMADMPTAALRSPRCLVRMRGSRHA